MGKLTVACLTLLLTTLFHTVKAATWDVTINTSNWSGTSASLAFDLIDGDNINNNTVQISNFLTDGGYNSGAATLTGGASGLLDTGAALTDSDFFNELLQPIVLGSSLQFRLQLSDVLKTGALVPDRFSFFILDEFGAFSLFPTTDPTSADSLFGIDLNGQGGALTLYASADQSPSWTVNAPQATVPEPSILILLASGFCLMARSARRTA
jgi:hypothetical protein